MKWMSEPRPPNDQNSSDIPLEDIDRLLEAEDPGFNKSLEEVRAVENDTEITIEAGAIDESLTTDDKFDAVPERGIKKLKYRLHMAWMGFRNRQKAMLAQGFKNLLVFFKTKPKEYLFLSIKLAKAGIKQSAVPLKAYREATRAQKITLLVLLLLGVGASWVLLQNFRGVWLPQLNAPLLRSFEPYADSVTKFDAKEKGESFYAAFPQERHEFLFPKIKVNLRRTREKPHADGRLRIDRVARLQRHRH